MTTAPTFVPEMTAFMLVKTLPEWLGLPVEERFAALRLHVEPLLKRYAADIRLRFYDTEFYSNRVTDVWMWEARTHQAYQLLVEALRETPFWDRYFRVVDILTGVENAYAANYNQAALSA